MIRLLVIAVCFLPMQNVFSCQSEAEQNIERCTTWLSSVSSSNNKVSQCQKSDVSYITLQEELQGRKVKRRDTPYKLIPYRGISGTRFLPNTVSGRAINKKIFLQETKNIMNDTSLSSEERARRIGDMIRFGVQTKKISKYRTY